MQAVRFACVAALSLVTSQLVGDLPGHAPEVPLGAAGAPKAAEASATEAAVTARMSKLPLRFEANAGQWDSRVRFRARQGGATLLITDDGMTIGLREGTQSLPMDETKSAAVSIKLVGAKPSPPRGEQELDTKSNFFLGNDPAKWRTSVANYVKVRAKGWLRGVDVVWHGGDSGLEYDLEVAAGVDAREVAFEIDGADSLRVNDEGALEMATAAGTLVQRPPRVMQDGRELHARYRVRGARRVALGLDAYDPARALLVDPVLTYATYLGNSGADQGFGIAVDSSGDAYVTGYTSGSFPTTAGAYQTTPGGNGFTDAFVAKLNAAGSALAYSTYLGGSGPDSGYGIAVDSSGNVYVTGWTSGSFPTTGGAFQTTYGGGSTNAFVAKLDAAGSALTYSTYLAGSYSVVYSRGIAVDSSGNAYVTGGTTEGFPTTAGASQTIFGGGFDAFVAKLNAAGSALTYSTYLGGSTTDEGQGVAVDSSGNAYVIGWTYGNFPTTGGAFQTTYGGGSEDAFVAKLDAAGSAVAYSTYLGGSGFDEGDGIAVDSSGNAYVTGFTAGSFPTTTTAFQTTFGGAEDAFAAKLNATGSALTYSTYLGGSGSDGGRGIAVDSSGNAYVTGETGGSFPTVAGAPQPTLGGSTDAFVAKLNAAGSALKCSTYLGGSGPDVGYGIAIDSSNNAYLTGVTGSFPTTPGAFQTTDGAGNAAFVAKLSDPELPNGASCTQAGACVSNYCVDGICCDQACTGQCQACDVTNRVGTCAPVTGAPHGSRSACGPSIVCGFCDGTDISTCKYASATTSCGTSCSGGAETDSMCDGEGACAGTAHSCDNLVCTADGTKCKTSCATDADCVQGFVCSAGSCTPAPAGGGGCSCEASSSGSPPWGTALLTVVIASAVARSRRRERGAA